MDTEFLRLLELRQHAHGIKGCCNSMSWHLPIVAEFTEEVDEINALREKIVEAADRILSKCSQS